MLFRSPLSWQDIYGAINHDVNLTMPNGNVVENVVDIRQGDALYLNVGESDGAKNLVGLKLDKRLGKLYWPLDGDGKFKGIDKISPAVAKVLRKYNDASISSYDDFDPVVNQITKDLRALSNKKQGAPNATAKTTESGGPAAGTPSAVGSSGDGSRVGDTTESAMANGTPLGSAGDNAVDTVSGAGKSDAALAEQATAANAEIPEETDIEKLKASLQELTDAIDSGAYGSKGDIEYDDLVSKRSGIRQRISQLEKGEESAVPVDRKSTRLNSSHT